MNPPRSLRRWLLCSAILIGGLILIAVIVLRDRAKEQANSDGDEAGEPVAKGDPKEAARMVDAAVNRNTPPKLVGRPLGSSPATVALYPESYDWKEEERVRQAIDKLHEDTTGELWEELVRRGADPSYCCVVVVPEDWNNAMIYTVGTVCSRLAYSRLLGVFAQHMPGDPHKGGRPLRVDLGFAGLAKWRKERMQTPLYQLQIEVGETMVRELSKVKIKDIPQDQIDSAREKIEVEIKKLRRTEQAVLLKGDPFTDLLYSKEAAKRVRDAVRRGSSGYIAIFK